jgi:hypothetical protein
MKISAYLSVFSVFLSVTACRSNKPLATVPVETKTIVKERLVEVQTPADSAWLVAYLECDSNYNVLIHSIVEKTTSGMQTGIEQSKIDGQKSKIEYRVIRIPEKIYIPGRDSIIYRDVPITVEIPVEVNRLTGWQYFQIWAGRISLLLLVIVAFWAYLKLKFQFK